MKELKNFNAECDNDITDNELLDDVLGKYKNKTEKELMEELNRAVSRAKEDGSFNEQSLKDFVELVSPHLSEEQLEKLNGLISAIESK